MTKLAKVKVSILIEQRNQRAHVGRMLIAIAAAIHRGYDRRHVGAIFEEFLVWSFIVVNDADGGQPVRVSDISARLRLPRTNVRRAVDLLTAADVLQKEGYGVTQNLQFFVSRVDSECFASVQAAIVTAADALRRK